MSKTYNYVIPTDSTDKTSSTTTTTAKRNTGTVSKDEFLNLLVTQMQYQDPLNPMDNTQFIGQMAQFSALEHMSNLNTSFNATRGMNLVGKYVEGKIVKDE
jgi:flagellar basal-body rod modification protein FlgD